jgi:hypothetical protein
VGAVGRFLSLKARLGAFGIQTIRLGPQVGFPCGIFILAVIVIGALRLSGAVRGPLIDDPDCGGNAPMRD